MNTTMPDPRLRRRRRLLIVPGTLLGLVLLFLLAAFVRGTWADETPRDPATVSEGPLTQVVRGPDGGKEVRCAIRLPNAIEEVWAVVTDYDNFGDICECIQAEKIHHEPDGTCRLEARARSGLPGTVPFAVDLRHERSLGRYVSSWDEAGGQPRPLGIDARRAAGDAGRAQPRTRGRGRADIRAAKPVTGPAARGGPRPGAPAAHGVAGQAVVGRPP
jgi:hypothetical protein